MAKLFRALKKPTFARLTPVVMLAAYAGLRRSEIIRLEWSDVNLDEGWLHVRAKRGWSPKTNASERSVPLTEELLGYLKGPVGVTDGLHRSSVARSGTAGTSATACAAPSRRKS